MPSKDFKAYIAALKKSINENISEDDKYNYLKGSIPSKVQKINKNLMKAFKKDDKKGDENEEQKELLELKLD